MKKTSLALLALVGPAFGQAPAGESTVLGNNRITQNQIQTGFYTLKQIRKTGLMIFSAPFNVHDGYGDGPIDPFNPDKTSPGNRPNMQDNGTFLRVNGLDSQACLECHTVVSNASIPAKLGVGGVGGIAATAMPGPTDIDIDDSDDNGFASYNGRLINPPFLFGAGGVELVGKEMTEDLQLQKALALASPDTVVPLSSHGVSFGTILFDSGANDFDTSGVQGVATDLVVRPFGRKGDNSSIRKFDIGALRFHQGMQPEEIVDDMDGDGASDPGVDNDPDGDGVFNEIMPGELSAMHLFAVTSDRPRVKTNSDPAEIQGRALFTSEGCASCHVPLMITRSRQLKLAYPEVETDPSANVYYTINLNEAPTKFRRVPGKGVVVRMFSDLKHHDMGPGLAESTGAPDASLFITPRLWGIADTAPYLHDGRALTLSEAIQAHGGEGQFAADNFNALRNGQKAALLAFLRTLRTPTAPFSDLDNQSTGGPFNDVPMF